MQLIYIYENDADIAFVLTTWLEQNGYTTMAFLSSESLIDHFNYSLPDCIILDNIFGGLAATTDLCNLIQGEFNYKGKILLSTTGKVTEEEWEACNAIDFISKPFDLNDVLTMVKNAFGSAAS